MIHELERLAKHYDYVEWKWDDGITPVSSFLPFLNEELGSRYLVRFKKTGKWSCMKALECSPLEKHTCHFCGRRGRKGFIAKDYISELIEIVYACIGCRSRYAAMRRRIHESDELAKKARKHLREIKGLTNESTKNHA